MLTTVISYELVRDGFTSARFSMRLPKLKIRWLLEVISVLIG